MKCFNLRLNFSIDVFKTQSSFANKSLTWFEEENRRSEKYIIFLCNSWVSLTRSSSWSIVACRIFVKTRWKCFIHMNCRLIVLANLALYSNRYSRFINEIRLSRMIFSCIRCAASDANSSKWICFSISKRWLTNLSI
jgi:hypothetical protein